MRGQSFDAFAEPTARQTRGRQARVVVAAKKPSKTTNPRAVLAGYETILDDLVELLESSRSAAARSVNSVMTTTYWLVGRRIVEAEIRRSQRLRR
jgi:hypothetical protein